MNRMKAVLAMSAAILFVTSPFYSDGFGGFEADQFPIPQVDPAVVPAGYAFSIWGLIYLLLLVHTVFGLVKRDVDPAWDIIRWPLIISLTLGASWIPVATINPVWATVLIWLMLVSGLVAFYRIDTAKDRLILALPIALYVGWLSAASFVSLGLLGAGYGLFFGEIGWAWMILIVATLFALVVQFGQPDKPEYGFAVSWALLAIAVRNWGVETEISLTAIIAALLLIGLAMKRHTARSNHLGA